MHDGLDDDVFLLFSNQVEGLGFLKVRVIAVHVDVDTGGIPFVAGRGRGRGRGRGLYCLVVASAV